jgi:hypothetical protein
MIDTSAIPFYRSYLLGGKIISLDKLDELTDADLNLLNIETLASLEEARNEYYSTEDKTSERANFLYGRLKITGYFQAAIKIHLQD